MRAGTAVFALAVSLPVWAAVELEPVLARLAEEAAAFAGAARKTIGQETLRQKAVKRKPRIRLRAGKAALKPIPPEYQNREIVSEYGFTSFEDNPNALHELRQVVSVDGRKVRSVKKARETLSFGMTSTNDRMKRKMLQDFEKHGLIGAVMDFGLTLLAFEKRSLANYSFKHIGTHMLGADAALVFAFEQVAGPEMMMIFAGRQAIREKLRGELWVRQSDYLPMRITTVTSREHEKDVFVTESTIDYAPSRFAALLPASIVYRERVNHQLTVQNIFEYSNYRQFGAESEIKFEVDPKQPD